MGADPVQPSGRCRTDRRRRSIRSEGSAHAVAVRRRSDVFAVRWENAATGKSGWSPAVRGGRTNRAKTRDYLPLTHEVFTRHLLGQATIGIYPLLRDDTCMLLACDFDSGSWVLDALAFLDACHDVEVPAALERSRSGNGAHVWIFFSAPVPAATARSLGASLLRRAMTARAELDLSSYDRFFPSQDFMPKGSFGNPIAVPLNGERLSVGATAFLDPTTLEPWPDQWRFLSSVARIAPEAVASLAESLRPVTSGPAMSLTDLLADDGPHLPDVVTVDLLIRQSRSRRAELICAASPFVHRKLLHGSPSTEPSMATVVNPPGLIAPSRGR